MKIAVVSVFVNDQAKALAFYTDVLGFIVVNDVKMGEGWWIALAAPDAPEGTQLLLEPNTNPLAHAYQTGLYEASTSAMVLGVDDVRAEVERLRAAGVRITLEPMLAGPVTTAAFDDSCGNILSIIGS